MRDDMFKVIVERPRHGRYRAKAVKLRHDRLPDRSLVGHKRLLHEQCADAKDLNENLAPLRRFLMKQRGRKWNTVFSEICSTLDTGSTVKMHVRSHIEEFIVVRISVDNQGRWFGTGIFDRPSALIDWWPELYVDPYDGIIKETEKLCKIHGLKYRRRWRRSHDQTSDRSELIWFSNVGFFMKPNDEWFKYELDCHPPIDNVAISVAVMTGSWRDQDGWNMVSQKQLSKKELKRHGLCNLKGRG
jgi:hypothetical protein